jgi:RNA polymerase sigma factor (sigma-70 family)
MPVRELEAPKLQRKFHDGDTDGRLVRACIQGSQQAWSDLIDRYKNLIFSIPLKYGFSREDAADIFQEVCLGLLSELPKLREPKALPKWLMQVTSHKCFHWRHRHQRTATSDLSEAPASALQIPPEMTEIVQRAEQEQLVRDAMERVPARCRRLVLMLFFEDPPRPYREVASDLGIAIGSIGILRQRCVQQLRKTLREIGVFSIETL